MLPNIALASHRVDIFESEVFTISHLLWVHWVYLNPTASDSRDGKYYLSLALLYMYNFYKYVDFYSSNEFKDFAKQSNFIGEIMAPIKEIWLSAEIKEWVL